MKHSKTLIKPFLEALEGYRATYMGARNLAPRSRVEYETDVVQFLLFLQSLGVKNFKKISPNHIRSYLAKLDKDGLEGVTRRKKLTIVRTFTGWLFDEGEITSNPAKEVVPPKLGNNEPRVLTKNEYQRLLSVVQNPRDRAIIQVLLQTGIRLSEIQCLTLSDIDLPKRIEKDALGTMRILGKGRKTRVVLLNKKACEALIVWLKLRPKVDCNALFLSSRIRPISSRQYQYLIGKYLRLANINGGSVHTLRHTFATHHIEMGTDLVTVQEFLGHKSLDTTKLYIGLARKRQAQHIQDHAL